ncbi:MAG TPA: transcriptional regulator [Saprospiraceae bacterium]|nr:transcriptional regulator [Saprospiraceae bacterium]
MDNIISKLNKVFDHRIRLGIMSILILNESLSFNILKETLDVTDGNLASHLKTLEKEKFIDVKKQFIGRKPNTTYVVTDLGKQAFNKHLNALEAIIKMRRKED